MMRKLATVRKIDDIQPIPEADAIEVAVVGGWKVVVKKGEYKIDDLAVYCEIDSWIPTELAPFLSKGKEPREFNGVKGERLRTVKLRGQISQGLLLPLEPFTAQIAQEDNLEGMDVTEILGIQKWEKPIPAQLAGQVKGNFPTLVPKTDQERIQNLKKELEIWREKGYTWEITEKLEGSSCTMYMDTEGIFHVCSRNLDLKEDENNAFWKIAKKYNVEEKLRGHLGIAIQGELIGPGVQGNYYNFPDFEFRVFDVYDVKTGKYMNAYDRNEFCHKLQLQYAPVIALDWKLFNETLEDILQFAESKSVLNDKKEREGIVFKCIEVPEIHFKAISNKFLMKESD
jgi:RNA ligase (TIGR02306 family)